MNTIYLIGAILFASAVFMFIYFTWLNHKATSSPQKYDEKKSKYIRV